MSTVLRLSVPEYDRMVQMGAFDHIDRRIEFIRGELREMNPAGPVHDELIGYLTEWSYARTANAKIRVRVQSELDLPEQTSRPEPDIVWVQDRRYFDRHPRAHEVLLAIEAADRSLQSDLTEKMTLYAEAGVSEYWIVDAKEACARTFSNPTGGSYRRQHRWEVGSTIAPICLAAAPLDIADLFGRLG